MRIKETKVYPYAELSPEAQSKARDWLRDANMGDNFFAESITESFAELLEALGFDISNPARINHGKGNTISWSGFSSQGDGAAFSGYWRAELCTPSAWLDDRPIKWADASGGHECPANKAWHDAAAPIIELAKKYPAATASVINTGRDFFMSLDSHDFLVVDPDKKYGREEWQAHDAQNDAAGEQFIEAARDLVGTFYRALEAEYEYQMSDAQIVESIEANEYEFTSDGSIA